MAILLVLLSGFILIHQMAEGKLVCIGEKEKLSCPAPKAEWKVKQLESDLHFPLVEWRSGRLFVMHNIPPSFQGRVLALSDGTLTISDFQKELDGVYICMSNFVVIKEFLRKAGYCSVSPCLGSRLSVEIGIYSRQPPVQKVELYLNDTNIQQLDSTLTTVFQTPKCPFYITNGRPLIEGLIGNGSVQFLKVRITYKEYEMRPQVQNIKVIPKVCASHAALASSSTPSKEPTPTTKKELEEDEKRSTDPPTLNRPSSNGELEQHEKKRANPPLHKQSGTQISIKVYFLFVCLVACFILMEYIPCV